MKTSFSCGVYERMQQTIINRDVLRKTLPHSAQGMFMELDKDETLDFLNGLSAHLADGTVTASYGPDTTQYFYKGMEVRLAPNHNFLKG